MSDNDKDGEQPKIKVVFMEGCFDEFDGTQEELNELIAQITELAESGELLENAVLAGEVEELEDEVADLLPLLKPTNPGNTRH